MGRRSFLARTIWCWNLLRWNFLQWQRLLFRLIDHVNPRRLMFSIPAVKRFYAKRGMTREYLIEHGLQVMDDIGINRYFADVTLMVVGFWFQVGLLVVFDAFLRHSHWSGLLQSRVYDYLSDLFLFGPPVLLTVSSFYYRKTKDHFREFNELPAEKKRRYSWMSFAVVLGVALFVVCCALISRHY